MRTLNLLYHSIAYLCNLTKFETKRFFSKNFCPTLYAQCYVNGKHSTCISGECFNQFPLHGDKWINLIFCCCCWFTANHRKYLEIKVLNYCVFIYKKKRYNEKKKVLFPRRVQKKQKKIFSYRRVVVAYVKAISKSR